ncbi:MAG: flagellar biosynthetic protein FliQ [Candidatus Auribacterota bacterium]|uniref:EscS/YscS/HrcS family type III secretion system export apparatus protein n=1 Tax=Candidatus Auribacter fodinae TaxID=2093366 RepID=A0A3A4QX62_9BACT|nr:MAG: EscS/YscS/HrcS family type III secretion system export apparatus protein [Candidatus Auribacter fodinae]
MTTEWVMSMARQTIVITLSIAMPMLGVGMVLGLVMSILQSVTALKDQSMMTVVKIVGVFGALMFSLPWIINTLVSFITNLFLSLPALVAR